MRKYARFLSIENFFIIISLVGGILFAVFVPVGQVPDEESHFTRVYAILHGNITSATINIPVGVRSFLDRQDRIPFYNEGYAKQDARQEVIKSATSSTYSPILYIPQLIGVGLGLLFRMSILRYFLLGRIFSVLLFSVVGYFILKATPVAKNSLFVLFSMPMTLYLAGSYSADTMQNILSFVYISLVLVGKNSPDKLSKKEWIFFLTTGALLALTKPISLVLIFLSILLPVARFKDVRQKGLFIASQLGVGLLLGLGWAKLISNNTFVNHRVTEIVPFQQLAYILINPIAYIKVLFTTLSVYSEYFLYGFVGAFSLPVSPMPEFVYFLFIIVLLLAGIADLGKGFQLTAWQKVLLAVIVVLYFVGLSTIMYLLSSPVASYIVMGVQGRYFIPIFPLVLVLILSLKPFGEIRWGGVFSASSVVLLVLVAAFGLQMIYLRYYTSCGETYYSLDKECMQVFGETSEFATKTVGAIDRTFRQSFSAECNDLSRVSILLMPGNGELNGQLSIRLVESVSKKVVVEDEVFAASVDNKSRWKSVNFSPVGDSRNKQYLLTVASKTGLIDSVSLGITDSATFPGGELAGVDFPADLSFNYSCRDGLVYKVRSLLGR